MPTSAATSRTAASSDSAAGENVAMPDKYIGLPDVGVPDLGLVTFTTVDSTRIETHKVSVSGTGFTSNYMADGTETAVVGGAYAQTSGGARDFYALLIESDTEIASEDANTWPVVASALCSISIASTPDSYTNTMNYPLVSGKYYNVGFKPVGNNTQAGQDPANGGAGQTNRDGTVVGDPPTEFTAETNVSRNHIVWVGLDVTPVDPSLPTLTTPYSIGTNNGPLFTIKTSDTLATIEGAGFFNDNAAYASLLKTGDVVLIEASNGTKLYNVTVDKTSRIITLSTGTAIA